MTLLVKELVQSSSFRVPYLTSLAFETEKIVIDHVIMTKIGQDGT